MHVYLHIFLKPAHKYAKNMNEISILNRVVKDFPPSWFASVMGTGALAIALVLYSKLFPVLYFFSTVLFWFNVFLFFVLLIPWIVIPIAGGMLLPHFPPGLKAVALLINITS